ncbi:uncharacterized protein SPAPADRAFT_59497, partial [Spathaspora passalidarum NRRL Y-27907]
MNQYDEEDQRLPANLYVSNEELIDYLRDKIILNSKTISAVESKINMLLKLCSIKCFI